jgi:hypothetical protein
MEVALGALAGLGFTLLMFAILWVAYLMSPAGGFVFPIFFVYIIPIVVAGVIYWKWKLFAFSVTMYIVSLLTIQLLLYILFYAYEVPPPA